MGKLMKAQDAAWSRGTEVAAARESNPNKTSPARATGDNANESWIQGCQDVFKNQNPARSASPSEAEVPNQGLTQARRSSKARVSEPAERPRHAAIEPALGSEARQTREANPTPRRSHPRMASRWGRVSGARRAHRRRDSMSQRRAISVGTPSERSAAARA